jgi:hypothetical protein
MITSPTDLVSKRKPFDECDGRFEIRKDGEDYRETSDIQPIDQLFLLFEASRDRALELIWVLAMLPTENCSAQTRIS